eukprot:CAMPEP_0185615142 /NCGR_PEP_ID=MMETSP0436-20130131/34607_1 /TAXON_ID=626734 ORGANISM="Favella taraikaensis, Strain Fe Narragansett Bay" /NCGR_SAMPLE_ID=MMETSP0436 /ASSEMBLY_ACC=CAM_ASM_000390 /LENGTH=52 /DNA_ID=CAMNT_0028250599 /DNA_START=998 /DNA_END=1153 /DNA_ORIENTATION=-
MSELLETPSAKQLGPRMIAPSMLSGYQASHGYQGDASVQLAGSLSKEDDDND